MQGLEKGTGLNAVFESCSVQGGVSDLHHFAPLFLHFHIHCVRFIPGMTLSAVF